jgi:hypothetical protein
MLTGDDAIERSITRKLGRVCQIYDKRLREFCSKEQQDYDTAEAERKRCFDAWTSRDREQYDAQLLLVQQAAAVRVKAATALSSKAYKFRHYALTEGFVPAKTGTPSSFIEWSRKVGG